MIIEGVNPVWPTAFGENDYAIIPFSYAEDVGNGNITSSAWAAPLGWDLSDQRSNISVSVSGIVYEKCTTVRIQRNGGLAGVLVNSIIWEDANGQHEAVREIQLVIENEQASITAYATVTDIQNRYGEDALFIVADRDDDNALNTDKIYRALLDSTAEMNAYIAQRYDLPLPKTPALLAGVCVDIALYRLSPDSSYTEEKRKRYEDAIKLLEKIAKGVVNLGVTKIQQPQGSAGDVEVIAPRRQFDRNSMGRLT